MQDAPYRPIPLYRRDGTVRALAIVDADDYPRVEARRWCLSGNGHVYTTGPRPEKEVTHLHRLLLGLTAGDGMEGDHINGDPLDNRRANLRIATKGQNAQNKQRLHPLNRSGIRGVSWDKARGRWRASATLEQRHIYLGRFDSKEEAAQVVAEWRAAHMPFATDSRYPCRA